MLKLGFRNQRFDDAVPLYVDISNGMVFNRNSGKQVTVASLNAAMAAENYTPKPGEVGKAPQAWLDANLGWWNGMATAPQQPPAYQAPTVTQPTGLPITGDTGGTQTTLIDINFHGNDIPTGGKMATVTYNVGATDQNLPIPLTAGSTPIQATTTIATAIDTVAELGAVRGTGTTIRVTPTDGTTLSKLTVAIA